MMTARELAKSIDHTLLKPVASKDDVIKLCQEAKEYGFASVCINPSFVPQAAEQLKGSDVLVCTVIGFPLGCTTTAAKVAETVDAVQKGAKEVDMVINIGALKDGRTEFVLDDIKAVVEAAQSVDSEAITKVIIETCYLTREEKILACELAKKAGAHFVKTSTGFGSGGATVEDIALMRETVGPKMGVKASGGIRNAQNALAMLEAGASRIGASAGIAIVQALTGK